MKKLCPCFWYENCIVQNGHNDKTHTLFSLFHGNQNLRVINSLRQKKLKFKQIYIYLDIF